MYLQLYGSLVVKRHLFPSLDFLSWNWLIMWLQVWKHCQLWLHKRENNLKVSFCNNFKQKFLAEHNVHLYWSLYIIQNIFLLTCDLIEKRITKNNYLLFAMNASSHQKTKCSWVVPEFYAKIGTDFKWFWLLISHWFIFLQTSNIQLCHLSYDICDRATLGFEQDMGWKAMMSKQYM